MKGISYLTDEKNEKIAVQIDLKKNNKLWEDFCDFIEGNKRSKEPAKSWESVKKNYPKGKPECTGFLSLHLVKKKYSSYPKRLCRR